MTRFRNFTQALAGIWIVCCLLLAATLMQVGYDRLTAPLPGEIRPVHRFILPGEVIRHFSFGMKAILADTYWIRAVQHLDEWDQIDAYYPEYFNIIATLDPKFTFPTLFAVMVIPMKEYPELLDRVTQIAERSIVANTENWEIPFYLGVQYHVTGGSREKALQYIAAAADHDGAPDIVRVTYGIYQLQSANDREMARSLFAVIYETSENETLREAAKERIELIDVLSLLEKAIERYASQQGRYPASMSDLLDAGYLRGVPPILQKFPVRIDEATGKVSLVDQRSEQGR
jgi:hypothetical protein